MSDMAEPKAIQIREVTADDREAWLKMRQHLWPKSPPEEVENYLRTGRFDGFDTCIVLVAVAADGALLGFAEISARPYADGCDTAPVAYLEGWYVQEEHRRTGIGRKLVKAAEDWGRAQGFTEFGSDADVHNIDSQKAHAAVGFTEAQRIVCFRKDL